MPMAGVGTALYLIGALIGLACGIWIAVLAFQESVLWGLGCLLLPIVSLVFVFLYWEIGRKPFLVSLGGAALMVVGSLLSS
jgi:hypothetical protein